MINKSLCRNWGWLFTLGILFIILGTAAIMLPYITTISTVIALGVILLIAGVVEFIQAIHEPTTRRKILHFLMSILTFVAGGYFIMFPGVSAITLTLILAVFLMMSGLLKSFLALALDYKYWGLLLINGIISFILGLMIYMQWPVSGLWIIGLFVGIDLILNGWSLLFFSWSVHKECQIQKK